MPTFNQLVRKGRETSVKKSTAPALNKSLNSLKKKTTDKAILELEDLGNTLLVVEHDEDTMYAADQIIDIGPGAGVHGGNVMAQRHC